MHVNGAAAGNEQLPIVVAPSRKLTVPAGLPAPGAVTVTVAVKVTPCPKTDGLAEDVRLVLVLKPVSMFWYWSTSAIVRRSGAPARGVVVAAVIR